MISANINIEKIKEAYKYGCDDYLKKPFDVEELILKIEKFDNKEKNIIIEDDVLFNTISKELFINNKKIELTRSERTLLLLLLENRGKAISHQNIEDYVYKSESKSSDAIRSLIKRLRKKLSRNLILNSIDTGYFIK